MLKNAFEFYYEITKLKDMLRQGAIVWNVKKERLESIAEHTFGCCILALSLQSELNLDINIDKVLKMMIIHEIEEICIGDVTPLDKIEKETLNNKAKEYVDNIVSNLKIKDELITLTDEFNETKTNDSLFAKAIDKLECVLEFKKYHDNGCVSLNSAPHLLSNPKLKPYLEDNKYDLADIFFIFNLEHYEKFGIDLDYWYNHLKNLKI